jgi:hypothetical protein
LLFKRSGNYSQITHHSKTSGAFADAISEQPIEFSIYFPGEFCGFAPQLLYTASGLKLKTAGSWGADDYGTVVLQNHVRLAYGRAV